jgi:DNA-directed RNA polymerase specialized sigma24 family protein
MGRATEQRQPQRVAAAISVTNPPLAELLLDDMVDWLDRGASLNRPENQAAACTWLLGVLDDLSDAVAARRSAAVRQLVADGWSYAEIGHALGVSRSRAHQLAER